MGPGMPVTPWSGRGLGLGRAEGELAAAEIIGEPAQPVGVEGRHPRSG